MVSRLPVYSGKYGGRWVQRSMVIPLILFVVLYAAFLMSFTWETLTLTTIVFLASLPISARSWNRLASANQSTATGAAETRSRQ